MPLLQTKNLTHIFDDDTVGIKDINISVESNEFIVISGANGCGKTVLMKHLNGLLQPTSGEVLFNGKNINHNITEARKNIGLIFQDSSMQIVGQTVKEDIAFGPQNLQMNTSEIENITNNAMLAMDLLPYQNKNPHTLSGGQKKRLAIAGVLVMKPQAVIFDEPFTGLDYNSIKNIIEQIVCLHKQNHTIIVITHELEKILAYTSRLIIMEAGCIIKDGQPQNIIKYCERYAIKNPLQKYESIKDMTWIK